MEYDIKKYVHESIMDARGYVTTMTVLTLEGKVFDIEVEGVLKEDLTEQYGRLKSQCMAYNRDMYYESGITWANASKLLVHQLMQGNEEPYVKGAGYLSRDVQVAWGFLKKTYKISL